MKLSILDQSPISRQSDRATALRETISMAQAADKLGFHRFWLAEHHQSPSFAGTDPAMMAMAVLDATTTLRVGSGGVLLGLHHPSEVAERFEILTALHPGRVDLGIGRAGSTDDADFTDRLQILQERLLMIAGHTRGGTPDIWLLGAGRASAPMAAAHGFGYAHAHFLNHTSGTAAHSDYADQFIPSVHRTIPEALTAVRVVVAQSAEEAQRLAGPVHLWRALKDLGRDAAIPDQRTAENWDWQPAELQRKESNGRRLLVGSASEVATQLKVLAESSGVEELMVTTPLPNLADRVLVLELLAEQFQMDADEPRQLTREGV